MKTPSIERDRYRDEQGRPPPTPAELREAAKHISAGRFYVEARVGSANYRNRGEYDSPCKVLINDARQNMPADKLLKAFADFILSHFPPDGAEPITADWLREEWGLEPVNLDKSGASVTEYPKGCWVYEDDDLTWPKDLTTRQQFRDLANLLAIEPKRKENE